MSTISSASSASSVPTSANAISTAADTTAAANAARASAAQSVISGSTGNASLDVSSLVTSLVNAKVAGQTGSLIARQRNDNTKLSAIGALQAGLSALQAGIAPLSNGTALGQFTVTADGTGLTASGSSGAATGSYSIAVTQIASAQTLSSAAFGATTALGTGTMNVSVGDKSMSVDITSANNTVSGIASAINLSSSNPGVTATVVSGTDGAHLILRSSATGASNTIDVSVSTVTDDAGLSSLGVTSAAGPSAADPSTIASVSAASPWTQTESAKDAMFAIDGTAGTSSGNTVTTAIEGVTLNLTAAAIGVPAGTPQTLTVAQDTTSASTAINNFVDLYNTLVTTYGQVAGFDSSKAKGAQGGPLLGNSMFNTIKSTLASIVSGGVKNGSSSISLGAIGIALNKDGTLTADSTKMASELTSNPEGMAALFNSTTGVAAKMTKSLNGFLGEGGLIANNQDPLNADLKGIGTQQDTLASYAAQLTQQYQAQFTALNTVMATMNKNSQYLTQLFGGTDSAGTLAKGKGG
ncbi:flagellar filament capping protein FliD [Caballeronia sp. LjRoot34]|uniref:flagellar filament capping protein FliD n=1 Tax=Caballeronia sp. LjRoot34 TaxID=3342325 RepID=UPI003ED0AA79